MAKEKIFLDQSIIFWFLVKYLCVPRECHTLFISGVPCLNRKNSNMWCVIALVKVNSPILSHIHILKTRARITSVIKKTLIRIH